MTPSFDRRNSYTAADNIKSRLVNKVKTPTFGELQYRFGKDAKSPSPVLDKDYQKEARQTVVGELSRYEMSQCFCYSGHLHKDVLHFSYGGNFQASRISGRRKPSQSPSMKLLGMLHVHDDPDGNY